MDKKTSLQMIEELSNAYGASGFEDEVLLVGRKYGEGLARIEENSIRDLFFYRNENTGNKPVILLDGHSDEVGFMVQAIKPNGTLQFIPLGGWVENTVPAHKVKVRNSEGKYISGIVASKPPHFMSSAEKGQNLPISAMVIDVGATSKEEVINDFKIRVGAPVVPDVTMEYNEKNGIVPKTIEKKVSDIIEISMHGYDESPNKKAKKRMTKSEREILVKELTKQMKQAAKLLDFELAAQLRDQIRMLESQTTPKL